MDNEIVIIGEKCDMWWDQNNFKLKKSFSSTMLNNLRNIVINNIIYIFCGKLECFENK
jgi:hypothetical protein